MVAYHELYAFFNGGEFTLLTLAGSHGSTRSEIILVFLLFNLWTLDWQIYIRIPNTPGVSNMFTCGSHRRISTYNSSLPCKVDFIRMKVKKYFSARISRYSNFTSSFQLSCLTISGDIWPNPGPPRTACLRYWSLVTGIWLGRTPKRIISHQFKKTLISIKNNITIEPNKPLTVTNTN